MKHLLVLLVSSLPLISFSQKQFAVLSSGDTIRPGARFKIAEGKYIHNIYPSRNAQASWKNIYTNYLNNEMTGKTYAIEKLTVFSKDKRQVGIFSIKDNKLTLEAVEYYINLDKAIQSGEIEIIK